MSQFISQSFFRPRGVACSSFLLFSPASVYLGTISLDVGFLLPSASPSFLFLKSRGFPPSQPVTYTPDLTIFCRAPLHTPDRLVHSHTISLFILVLFFLLFDCPHTLHSLCIRCASLFSRLVAPLDTVVSFSRFGLLELLSFIEGESTYHAGGLVFVVN